MDCPRRGGVQDINFPGPDNWCEDHTCSYCGSLNPEEFLRRLELGDVSLTPTDKSYKVYIRNTCGEPFRQSFRVDNDRTGDKSKWVLKTDEVGQKKFYFQHLTLEQKQHFVDLFNSGKMKLDFPGHFYVMPYFMRYADGKDA